MVCIFSKYVCALLDSSNELTKGVVFDSLTNNFTILDTYNNKFFTISEQNLTISTNKRTKEAKQLDEINQNYIRPRDVKQAVLSEEYSQDSANPRYKHSHPQHDELYKYRNYDKYKTQHKYNNPKYNNKGKKTQDGDECKQTKGTKHLCTAFLMAMKPSPLSAYMTQSLNGRPIALAATYVAQDIQSTSIFSNKA